MACSTSTAGRGTDILNTLPKDLSALIVVLRRLAWCKDRRGDRKDLQVVRRAFEVRIGVVPIV